MPFPIVRQEEQKKSLFGLLLGVWLFYVGNLFTSFSFFWIKFEYYNPSSDTYTGPSEARCRIKAGSSGNGQSVFIFNSLVFINSSSYILFLIYIFAMYVYNALY